MPLGRCTWRGDSWFTGNRLVTLRAVKETWIPYTPVHRSEQLSAELDLPVDRLVKLDANANPYIAPAKIPQRRRLYVTTACHLTHLETAMRVRSSVHRTRPALHYLYGARATHGVIDLLKTD